MKIKIQSAELNRMMKTISQCIDPRFSGRGNIEFIYDNNMLSIRGTNGQVSAVVSTPVLGGDGEIFCIDGSMFAKVCALCNGEVEISTDGKNCTVKGAGRTRLPIISADIPSYSHVDGPTTTVLSDDLTRCYKSVAYAVSEDQSRVQLTGILTEVGEYGLKMTALDGFQMSIETAQCRGEAMKAIIPGTFMKLVVQGACSGADVKLRTDGKRIEAVTDGMMLVGGLLTGEFPDTKRILPTSFTTECLVRVEELRNALKSGAVVNSKQNLVKLDVSHEYVKVMSNSEEADYDADVPCDTQGNELKIAFNNKYLMNTINAITTEDAVLKLNSSVSPCVVQGKDEVGIRLLLPVRVAG